MRKLLLVILLFSACIIQGIAQERVVTGVVTDKATKEPLPGVSVAIMGSTSGAITDIDGKFSVKATDKSVLIFSFIGYTTRKEMVDQQTTLNIALESEAKDIDEVVVVGYGTQKKSLVTGAIAKVSSEDLMQGASARIDEALQGKTAGVTIMSNSGQPGDLVTIRVRGTGTNGNADPLYIVDGLTTSAAGLDYLNPSDIESIEVLKDAASCAIYGAEGANGVVLISTKSGKRGGKFEVSYDGYFGVQNPLKKMTVLNKDQYIEMMKESYANAGAAFPWSKAALDSFANTDWQAQMFTKNAPKLSHTVSFSGGGDKYSYSSSISVFKQNGIVAPDKSNFQRYSWRLNTEREFGMLTVGMKFNIANIQSQGISANSEYAASLDQALNLPPILPIYNWDGSYATPDKYLGIGMQEITNPVALLSVLNQATVTNKVNAGMWGVLDFEKLFPVLKGLSFKTQYSTEYAYVNYRTYSPVYYFSSTQNNPESSMSESLTQYVNWNFDNFFTYDRKFDLHHITLLAGFTAQENTNQDLNGSKKGLIFNSFTNSYLSNATDNATATTWGGYGDHTMASYVGRINYDFNNKYMMTATLRSDGSSNFGPNNKYATFPSISGGWVISNEGFMSQFSNILSLAKLRASWGQTGNEAIGAFAYTTTLTNYANAFFGQNKTQYNGTLPTQFENPNLKWETSQQTDIGLETGFYKNSLTLTLDYYDKRTRDWLVTAPIMNIAGNNAPVVNGGEISNKGFEFELGYKKNLHEVNINVSLTGAFNKNEVLAIDNASQSLIGGTGMIGQSNIKRFQVGQPAGYFYGIQVAGIFQTWADVNSYVDKNGNKIQPNAQPGDFKFVDQNGDGKIDDNDRINLGDPNPKFTGGINFNINWKGFDFNMFWYTALGQKAWMSLRRYDMTIANYTADYYNNRWTGAGTSNTYPRVSITDPNNNWTTPSSFYVQDASYMRLKNLTLGYTLPKSILQTVKLSKIRIYISGENLLLITKYPGYDPEIGGGIWTSGIDLGNYPQARTILGGINITF